MDATRDKLRMVGDLLTGGDPTWNPRYPENLGLAQQLTGIRDYMLRLFWRNLDGQWDMDWLNDHQADLIEPVQTIVIFVGWVIAQLLR